MPLRGKALLLTLFFFSTPGLIPSLFAQDGSPTGKCGFQNLTIHSPAGTSTFPTALNDKGSTVGLLFVGNGTANARTIGFYQQSSGTFASFNFPGAHDTFAHDINKNGLIVGSWDTQPGQIVSTQHAFKVQNGVFKQVTIPGFPGVAATAEGVNDLGDIVGQFNDHGTNVGFLLHNGKLTIISFPGAKEGTLPTGINDSGVVVGTYLLFADDIPHGFIWKNGNFTNLTTPGGLIATPTKISNNGDIVGSFIDANGIEHGFSLDKGRFTTIDFPGSADTRILGVNSLDNIIGLASVKSGTSSSNINFKGSCSAVF